MARIEDVINAVAKNKLAGENAKLIGSKDTQQRDALLQVLRVLGGLTVGDDDIEFTGNKLILPATYEGRVPDAIEYLKRYEESQNKTYEYGRTFRYRPYDGANAFQSAMKATFGTTGIGADVKTMFGNNPPQMETISIGPEQTTQVPWGHIEFPPLSATFMLSAKRDRDYGVLFHLGVEAPRKYRREIDAFFQVVEDYLKKHSIYKGKAITGASTPVFVDTTLVDPDKVVYSEEVLTQLDANVWSLIDHTQIMRDLGIPLKRAVLIEGPYGTGKAQPVSEPVLTPNGWTTIGSLKVGDSVVGVDGLPTMVLGVFPQQDRSVLRVTFSDGSWTRTNPEHLWEVDRGPNNWTTEVLTTQQIMDIGTRNKHNHHRFRAPMVDPVQFAEKNFPVEPYALGVILGDGHVSGGAGRVRPGYVQITTDKEIINELNVVGTVGHHKSDGVAVLSTDAYMDGLVQLGLAGKKSADKFVPNEYLFGSVDQRWALLSGLLDTDGSANHSGGVEFCSTSLNLVESVVHLVQSLGGVSNVPVARQTYYTYQNERKAGQVSYRVLVRLPKQPFRLARKMIRWVAPIQRSVTRYIESITIDQDEDNVCIKVDHPRELYVTRSFIVTHNTLAGALTAQHAVKAGWTFILCRPGEDDLFEVLRTAQLYSPAVVWYEDIDTIANGGSPEEISRLLDALDGINAKGAAVMAGFTTNHKDKIQKGVLRPGRLDAIIHIGSLDQAGFTKLIKNTVPTKLLAPDINYERVASAFAQFMPAFAKEAIDRAMRYSVARNQGKPDVITTDDLVNAAIGLYPQLELMTGANEGPSQTTLGTVMTDVIEDVVGRTRLKHDGNENLMIVGDEVNKDPEDK